MCSTNKSHNQLSTINVLQNCSNIIKVGKGTYICGIIYNTLHAARRFIEPQLGIIATRPFSKRFVSTLHLSR